MERSFLVFYVGVYALGIPAEELIEVNRNLRCTQVPGSPKMIRGILNLRGLLMPAVDMGAYLEIADSKCESFSIILKVQENNIALMVDSIGDIMTFNTAELVLPPTHLSGQFQEAIQGAFRLSEGLLIILDTGAILRNAQNPHGSVLTSLQAVSVAP
ncbi:chemotaxis protein CheW [Polynucleobacter nymphae]|jgi:purine-binding chemotaxis protein CheW|uniref:chemotaxis protein CheW n=1 Tax=Polynucleobacter nymphae TaxID=2081043 RepID=UPI001C0CA01E|nr:chemotaxis protein CheW [Polynucleobacter nymphae]MBU3607557.1 chemotaxis protein CheW [Polynucleobacter nymphae]